MVDQIISYSGRRWANPNEIIYKMYDFFSKEIRRKAIKYGDRFSYPELATDLRDNHYFLKENNIIPEFFTIQKDPQSDAGFSILLFSSKFPSQYQYRKIEVQPANNYPYKKDLLRARLDDELKRRQLEIFEKSPTCQRCSIKLNKNNFQAIYEHFEIEKMIDQTLLDFSKSMFYSAVQYNYAKTDRSRLNLTNPLVKSLLKKISQVNIILFFPKCVDIWAKEHLMEELINPATSDIHIRHIIRQMTRKNLVDDLKIICDKVTTELSQFVNREDIPLGPSGLKMLWQEMHFIARDLYEFKTLRPFISDWAKLLSDSRILNSWIGEGLFAMMYRLDQPEWNEFLVKTILNSQINLFRFFRTMGQYTINTNLIDLLFNYRKFDQSKEQLLLACFEGYFYTRQLDAIQPIFKHLAEFSFSSQRKLIVDFFELNLDNGNELIQKLFFTKEDQKETPTSLLNEDIKEYLEQIQAAYEKINGAENLNEINNESKIKEEELIISKEHAEWKKKKGPSLVQMRQIAPSLITDIYRPIIEQHVAKYKSEFEQFFRQNPEPIAALDIEEMNFRMFCVLAIEIKPDLSIFIKLIAVDDIYPLERYAPPLRQQIRTWLKSLSGKYVVSHGSNEEEVGMITDAGHIQINTQDTLHRIRFLNPEYSMKIKGEGLKHFEEYIDFKRAGCEFLKHDIPSGLFFHEAMLSLDHHLSQTPQRTCGICNKTQDVLLYCLEDAFSGLLIHVYFTNREGTRL